MLRRDLVFVSLGILALSGMFLLGQEPWSSACPDIDGDGYGNPPSPYCLYPYLDCDDLDPDIHPGAVEAAFGDPLCKDGRDNDCDGFTDSEDEGCAAPVSAKLAGARYRSFANTGGEEVYLGTPDLGVAANREATEYTWAKPASHDITFSYDKLNDKLIATVSGPNGSASVDFPGLSGKVPAGDCTLDNMDSIEIIVADRDVDSQVNFVEVELGGAPVGGGTFIGDGMFRGYVFSSSDLSDGFTFTGSIELEGPFSISQELSKVEIDVGCNLIP